MDAPQLRLAVLWCISVFGAGFLVLGLPAIVFVCGARMVRRGRAQITQAWAIQGRPARFLGICCTIVSVASLVCYGVGGYVLFSGSSWLDSVIRWLPRGGAVLIWQALPVGTLPLRHVPGAVDLRRASIGLAR